MPFVCLAYHRLTSLTDAGSDPYATHPRHFRAQMAWLARHGYRGISLGDAMQNPGGRVIALTFDDGYRDFYTTAWPILNEFGFGATLFVVSGRVGQTADWPGTVRAPLLTWTEMKTLSAQGVEIGAHGVSHRRLDELPRVVMQAELRLSRQVLVGRLGCAPAGFAYPYGRCSPEAIRAAQEAGFEWAATARGGINRRDSIGRRRTPRFKLRRTLVTGRDWGHLGCLRFALKVRTGYASPAEWRMDLRRVP